MSDGSSVAINASTVTAKMSGALKRAKLAGITDDYLEEVTEIPARTIRSYRNEGKEPGLTNALKLWYVLGPKYSDPVVGLLDCRLVLIEEHDRQQDLTRITSDGLQAFAIIAKALSDGRISHDELPACQEAANELIRLCLNVAHGGK